MVLTSEQKQAVATWVTAGDNLSAIQRKLSEQFQVTLTYMDVRFLVDDLNLELKDPKPAKEAAPQKETASPEAAKTSEKKSFIDKMKEKVGLGAEEEETLEDGSMEPGEEELEMEPNLPASASSVTLDVDKITLIPGALASGSVTFSDGVTGKWIVDQYGRPGFTEVSKPGYRPSPADAQAFMQQLSSALQRHGY